MVLVHELLSYLCSQKSCMIFDIIPVPNVVRQKNTFVEIRSDSTSSLWYSYV